MHISCRGPFPLSFYMYAHFPIYTLALVATVSVFCLPILQYCLPITQRFMASVRGFYPPDLASVRGFSPPDFDSSFSSATKTFSKTFNAALVVGMVSSIVGPVVLVLIVYAVIKCVREQGLPPVNITKHGWLRVPQAAPDAVLPETCIFMPTMERFLEDMAKEKPLRFSPQDLASFTRNYATRLGSGGFGVVYKGEFPNGVQVAVKVLNKNIDTRVEEQFMAEVGTMGRTYHINLVRLYGFCFDADVKALVYEYMEKGSLDRYLFDRSNSGVLPWRKLQEIAVGTAKGITYLHEECQQRIIHYDIKPGNVLLDSDFSPKVADFGLAKLYDRAATHVTLTGGRGTPGYAAPELWMPLPVTHKCDVYSFGMLLFEVVGRRRNFNTELPDSQEWLPRWVWEKFEKGLLEGAVSQQLGVEEQDSEEAVRMAKVALWCVQYLPADRPEMSRVVKMLEGELEVAAPLNPFEHLAAVDMGSQGSLLSSSETSQSDCNGVMPNPNMRNFRHTA